MTNVRRAAFDIETVSPALREDERPDFTDSRDFELSGAAIAYEYSDGSTETVVEWRQGWGPRRELDLIETLLERLEPAETLVTYNGERFDLAHLEGRARIAGAEVGERAHEPVQTYLSGIEHVDLQPDAWAAYGKYTSLEQALTAVGLDPVATLPGDFAHGVPPSDWANEPTEAIESADLAVLGEIYLDAVDGDRSDVSLSALEEMLSHYARADAELLFDLADRRPFE
ncbi:ribonuclease H-like domain-containing protein [Halobaculum litoreum]|uniref:Ribonuclease H-like domain-containing protein n=1 Tax=Halobaculum litoreum TaxID=3031998 RepID=A0ABD5XWW5_9EURY